MKHFVVEVNGIGLVKRLYGGNAARAGQVAKNMRSYGWTERFPEPGSVGIIRATTFKEAAQQVFAKQGLAPV